MFQLFASAMRERKAETKIFQAITIAALLLACDTSNNKNVNDLEEKKVACEPTEECRSSNTGALFVRDFSNLELGEAYRDPSGLVWGSLVMHRNYVEASNYCDKIGARLPTETEFRKLAKYFGAKTKGQVYSPYMTDNKTEVIPRFTEMPALFSSSAECDDWCTIYVFETKTGDGHFAEEAEDLDYWENGTICVDKSKKQ